MNKKNQNFKHFLVEAIAKRYPRLNARQRERLEAAILRELDAALKRGEDLAILKPLPDGSFEISRMVVERKEADGGIIEC